MGAARDRATTGDGQVRRTLLALAGFGVVVMAVCAALLWPTGLGIACAGAALAYLAQGGVVWWLLA